MIPNIYEWGTGAAPSGASPEAPTTTPDALPRSCVTFARYAKLTGYSECAIMGVNHPDETYGDCDNPIWTQFQRDALAHYLAEAQEEIEQVTRYPLCPTYIADEEHPFTFPLRTRWTKVIAAGVRAETVIAELSAVSYATEPAAIGPLLTSVTDAGEIRAFYPDSDREIPIQRVSLAGGVATLYIPRCRLVSPDYLDTPQGGLDYTDDAFFLEGVDVRRVYTDESVNAEMVWSHRSSTACPSCGCLTCGEHTETACLYVRNAETGALNALQATYESSWTAGCGTCYRTRPDKIRVNYLAGANPTSLQAENAVVRLAHSKMPYSPCGCDVLRSMWTRDNVVPEVLTSERENCPFGMSNGAWTAWKFANSLATRRLSVI